MFYQILEKRSYYNKPQAHFLGGSKTRESLAGKSQQFVDQLKQGLPQNLQNAIQNAHGRGGAISPTHRKQIDEHIRHVASTQNRGQRTNVNVTNNKRTFIGPSGQGFADRGMYTGELYNRPGMGSQIVQENVPRARSGQRGISSVTGHSAKRSPSGQKVQLRDIEIQRAREERAVLKKQRKLKGIERRKALDAARLKEQSTSDAIANFAAEKAQRNVRPEVAKQTKSNKVKVPRKLKKKLKKELAQQAVTDASVAPSVVGADVTNKAKSGFKPTMKNNPNLIDNPNLKVTPAERFTENLKKPTSKVTPPPIPDTSKVPAKSSPQTSMIRVPAKSSPRVSSDYSSGHHSPRAKSTTTDTLDKAKSTADNWKSNRRRNIGLGLGAAALVGAGLAYRRHRKNKELKRRQEMNNMNKVAYSNYYSDYLSPEERLRSFKEAKTQMAARELGLNTEARSGRMIGGIGGGLIGLGTGLEAGGGPGALVAGGLGALAGGGLGYLIGSGADSTRDRNTREARELIRSKENLERGLAGRRARMYDMRDEEVREMDRADSRSRRIQAENTGRPSVVMINNRPEPRARVVVRPRASGRGRVVVRDVPISSYANVPKQDRPSSGGLYYPSKGKIILR